jgi:hydrogenase-4 membrane subunit HyfE
MNPLLLALLGALLIPLFVSTWRMSLFGLGLQGLIMAAIAYPGLQPMSSAPSWLSIIDLALVRGILAPLALYTVLRAQGAPARNDVISANLFSWTLALGTILVGFNFSESLVSEAGESQTLVAVAVAGVLLGFLVLASAVSPFSQMIGALRVENSIALLELSGDHHSSFGLQLAMLAILVATIGFFRWYLATLEASESEGESAPDGLTL